MRLSWLICIGAMLVLARPVEAAALDLDTLTDRVAALVSLLTGGKPDPAIIAPPRDLDRKMVLTPPRVAVPIPNLLPRRSGPSLEN